MKYLGKLFGSDLRVKLMRLFLFSPREKLSFRSLEEKTLGDKKDLRRELKHLHKLGFLKKRKGKEKTKTGKVREADVWSLNEKFPVIEELYLLLIQSGLIDEKGLVQRLKKVGIMKFIVLSGVFLQKRDQKADLLLVGKKIKKSLLEREIELLESEIGTPLNYAVFEEEEFQYRLDMHDKLLRDILENEHKVLLDKRRG